MMAISSKQSDSTASHPTFFRLVDGVRLRREYFGGLVYEPTSGTTIELDKGAFRFAELAATGISIEEARLTILREKLEDEISGESIISLAQILRKNRVITPCSPIRQAEYKEKTAPANPWPNEPMLTAPEAAHFAVTFRCDAHCPDCYAALHREKNLEELSTERAKKVVDTVAGWGVFQLAIGGGEPLVRRDLSELTHHAAMRGLAVHVTTGSYRLGAQKVATLADSVTCLQIGIRHHEMLGDRAEETTENLTRLLEEAKREGLSICANLVLCRSVLKRFEALVCSLYRMGFRRLTLLRYKPPSTISQWKKESPTPRELNGMAERIGEVRHQCSGLEIRLDCALSFLERDLDPQAAFKAGMRGCVAAARIIAISPDGSVYPCSQLVTGRFRAGNIIEDDPDFIWRESKVLSTMRHFRETTRFQRSACGVCRAREFCGGCRIFSHEGFGPDPGCPESVIDLKGEQSLSLQGALK